MNELLKPQLCSRCSNIMPQKKRTKKPVCPSCKKSSERIRALKNNKYIKVMHR